MARSVTRANESRSALVRAEAIDAPHERSLTRLVCLYSLARVPGLPRNSRTSFLPPQEAFPLGRFGVHFDDDDGTLNVFPAACWRSSVLSTEDGEVARLERIDVWLLFVPRSGAVVALSLDTQCNELGDAVLLLQQTCFNRDSLAIDRVPLLEAIESSMKATAAVDIPDASFVDLAFNRDVHQIIVPGVPLSSQLADSSGEDIVYNPQRMMRLVYREDRDFRRTQTIAHEPRELNRQIGSFCMHGRGVTALIGAAEHVEWGLTLTAAELLGAVAKLREIQAIGRRTLRWADEGVHSAASIAVRRQRATDLARTIGAIHLELSFGVETYLDDLRTPEIILQDYRQSLGELLGLPQGVSTTGTMLERLKTVLETRRAELMAIEQRITDIRRVRHSIALGYITLIAIPIGLILAFLATDTTQVKAKTRSIFDIAHFGPYYGSIVGVLLVGLALWAGAWVWAARRIPKVLSEASTSLGPSTTGGDETR